MQVQQRPSGPVVPVPINPPQEEVKPTKRRDYRVAKYGDWGAVKRHMEAMFEADGVLISITRHGSKGVGICVDNDDCIGYIIVYLCNEQIGTWEYT